MPSSEPNTRNSTTAAASSPTTSAMPCPGWPCAAAPVISISTLLLLSRWTASTTSCACFCVTSPGTCPVRVTVANAVRPSLDTCCARWGARPLPVSYGDATDATAGSALAAPSARSKAARTAGSVTLPELTWTTAVNCAPDAAGLTFLSRSSARLLSVLGNVNWSL